MLPKSVPKNSLNLLVIPTSSRNFETKGTVEAIPTRCPRQAASAPTEEVDWNNARPFKEIPGPTRFELVRGFLPGGVYYKKPVTDFFNGIRRKYGDIAVIPAIFGKKAIIFTSDPEIHQKVFRNEGIWPMRRNFDSAVYFRKHHRKEYFRGVEGLLMTSGEPWGHFRTAVNPVLMNPKYTRQYLSKMLPVNDEFLQRIREIRDPDTLEMPDTFIDDINRLTFESVAVIALDQQLGLIRQNRDSADAKKLFTNLREFFDLIYVLDVQPSMWKIIKTPSFHKMMAVSESIFKITSKYIEDALARIEQNSHSKGGDDQKSVVEKLAEQDKRIAIVMAMDLLISGVDTTSSTLTGILFGIATNPQKQTKLREEIRAILPEKDSVLTIEKMKNLPYLRACIKEGIRMYPIGPGTGRSMPKDVVLNGYQVPKGTDIAMGVNVLLREAKYFPHPDEFIPERWLRTEGGDTFKPDEVNPFVYLPFGFGPRSCVGKRIVELELELTIMRLVRNFYMEFNYSMENAFSTQFVARPIIPLKFKFAEVEN